MSGTAKNLKPKNICLSYYWKMEFDCRIFSTADFTVSISGTN